MRKLLLSLIMVAETSILSAQSYSEHQLSKEEEKYYSGKNYYIQNREGENVMSVQCYNFSKEEIKVDMKSLEQKMILNTKGNDVEKNEVKTVHHIIIRFNTMTSAMNMSNENSVYTTNNFKWSGSLHNIAEADVADGTYDILVNQYDAINTKDMLFGLIHNLNVNRDIDTTFDILASANNYMYFHGKDKNNEALLPQDASLIVKKIQISIEFPNSYAFQCLFNNIDNFQKDYIRFSNFDSKYKICCEQFNVRKGEMYLIDFGSLNGITGNVTLENNPINYRKMATVFHESPAAVNNDYLTFGAGFISRLREKSSYNISSTFETKNMNYPSHNKDTLKIYLTNDFNPSNLCNFVGQISFWENKTTISKKFTTNPFYVSPVDSIQFCTFYPPTAAYYKVPINAIVDFGNTTPFFYNKMANTSSNIINSSYIYGQCNENRIVDKYFSLYSIKLDTNVIKSDTLYKFTAPYTTNATGSYSFSVVDSNYTINNVRGCLQLQNVFNMPSDDPNPPVLTSFKIEDSDGFINSIFLSDKPAFLHFSATDLINGKATNVKSVELYYKKYGTDTWASLPVNEIPQFIDTVYYHGQYFTSNLASALHVCTDSTFLIDLKLVLTDVANNTATEIFHPAFSVKYEHSNDVNESTIKNELKVYPNPVKDILTIEYQSNNSPYSIDILNILGNIVYKSSVIYNNTTSINLKSLGLPDGIYIVQSVSSNAVVSKKIIFNK